MALSSFEVITLVLADDHVLFRRAILDALAKESGMRVLADVADGTQAFQAIVKHRPHVAVLDVEMPGWTGLDVARAIREQGIATAIVLLTMHQDPYLIRSAQELGVLGYVLKDDLGTDLSVAIRAAAEKRAHFSASLPESLRTRLT